MLLPPSRSTVTAVGGAIRGGAEVRSGRCLVLTMKGFMSTKAPSKSCEECRRLTPRTRPRASPLVSSFSTKLQQCYSESGKGDAAIKSLALGLL